MRNELILFSLNCEKAYIYFNKGLKTTSTNVKWKAYYDYIINPYYNNENPIKCDNQKFLFKDAYLETLTEYELVSIYKISTNYKFYHW